jgi:hypothetical protein
MPPHRTDKDEIKETQHKRQQIKENDSGELAWSLETSRSHCCQSGIDTNDIKEEE